jgi:tetratricopeptide (TPR) repeat protein
VEGFYLRPRYHTERPLDNTLRKVDPALDRFPTEQYAAQILKVLERWSATLQRSPQDVSAIASAFSPGFRGASPEPSSSRTVRSNSYLQVQESKFSSAENLPREAFLRQWQAAIAAFSKIDVAEFQITAIDIPAAEIAANPPKSVETRIRYEVVGSGPGFHREQRVGNFHMVWLSDRAGEFLLQSWRTLDETRARAAVPVYLDVTAAALGHNSSYSAQLLHGSDYWRTVLDGACGIDIYGHNGVSIADIDNDGFDDIYICQPAGLPNRLYRNRGDGTFEDITESSGLGILENTACALFADFDNDGRQDVIVVRTTGPLLFVNQGNGQFRVKPDAFNFENPPQGTFTGAALADYDRDGWLDAYFCLYAYYQGTGQYRYPSPYHDAGNGPPNFLMRNNRDGTFRDVTAASGMSKNNTRYSFCCGWNDYNRDGWPDLYVVNDFGRKNLYRNNGDGTFTDVAPQVRAEDVGAGMSVNWLDYDNDGRDDLYVANMWTAAGVRISMQPNFKTASSPEIRALYQKHAMGNSLLHNSGEKFEETTSHSDAGIGRWAWSSDAFDFDHDGFPDLYVTNGMVTGHSRSDLNSFFWRQVVANSPDEAGAAPDYEQGWNAINELIRSDGTWSGYERDIFFANNGDGTFSDVSGAIGLDFIEDGRSFGLADIDHDGRLEIVLKNRNAPQLRVLKNVIPDLPPSVSFRLQGTRSNRDAIGAVITIETSVGRQTRSLQAGSGFLSQHSKDIFFGLGQAKGTVHASIRWPSGQVQELRDLPVNHRIWITEGSEPHKLEPFKTATVGAGSNALPQSSAEALPTQFATWLLSPLQAPDFSLPDIDGNLRSLAANKGKPLLLSFWTAGSQECQRNLETFQARHRAWATQGLQLVTINVDDVTVASLQSNPQKLDLSTFARSHHLSFPILRCSEDVAAIYNILYRQLFDRHRDLSLPTSFLIDESGDIVKAHQGPIVAESLESDFRQIPRSEAERLAKALPFSMPNQILVYGRNYLSSGSIFYQRGYLDQAEAYFERALKEDPSTAEALYGIGSVYLNQNKNAAARDAFERCVKLQASYPDTITDAWNNLGVLATREGRIADSIQYFEQALKLSPRHVLTLDNLGKAYRVEKRWDDARRVLQQALDIAPDDAEANYSLGMVYAQTKDSKQAYEYLQRALKARPDYPEALNNLGILYLLTERRDEAVATFEQCIRVAPTFDQAYVNLARVYAMEGTRDKAREVLLSLLKQNPDDQPAKQMLQQLQ